MRIFLNPRLFNTSIDGVPLELCNGAWAQGREKNDDVFHLDTYNTLLHLLLSTQHTQRSRDAVCCTHVQLTLTLKPTSVTDRQTNISRQLVPRLCGGYNYDSTSTAIQPRDDHSTTNVMTVRLPVCVCVCVCAALRPRQYR